MQDYIIMHSHLRLVIDTKVHQLAVHIDVIMEISEED